MNRNGFERSLGGAGPGKPIKPTKVGDKKPIVLTKRGQPRSKTGRRQKRPLSPQHPVALVSSGSTRRNAGTTDLLNAPKDPGGRHLVVTLPPSQTPSEERSAVCHRIDARLRTTLYPSGLVDQNIHPNLLLSHVRQSINQEEELLDCRKPFIMDVILDLKANLADELVCSLQLCSPLQTAH